MYMSKDQKLVLPLSRKFPFFGQNLRNFGRLKEFFKEFQIKVF